MYIYGVIEGLCEDKYVFALPLDLSHPPKAIVHGSKKGILDEFLNDIECFKCNCCDSRVLDALQEGLAHIFQKRILEVIKENWQTKGVEYTIGGFFMLHEEVLMEGTIPMPYLSNEQIVNARAHVWQIFELHIQDMVAGVFLGKREGVGDSESVNLALRGIGKEMIRKAFDNIKETNRYEHQAQRLEQLKGNWFLNAEGDITAAECYQMIMQQVMACLVIWGNIDEKAKTAIEAIIKEYIAKEPYILLQLGYGFCAGSRLERANMVFVPLSPKELGECSWHQRQNFLVGSLASMGVRDSQIIGVHGPFSEYLCG